MTRESPSTNLTRGVRHGAAVDSQIMRVVPRRLIYRTHATTPRKSYKKTTPPKKPLTTVAWRSIFVADPNGLVMAKLSIIAK